MHRRVRTVVVGNVGKLQGNIPLLPDAKPDDGILDVVVIATRNVLDWARVGGRVLRRADVPDRRMERFTGKHVLIEASHTQPRQLDGDVIEDGRTMDITVEPGALQVRVRGRREPLMSSVTRVPQTRTMDGGELSADDARTTLRHYGRLRLVQGLVRPVPVRRRLQPLARARAAAGAVADPAGHRVHRAGRAPSGPTGWPSVLREVLLRITPGSTDELVRQTLEKDQASSTGGELALWIGLGVAVLALTTAMGQVERGANRIYGIQRDRPTLHKYGRAVLMACTAGLLSLVGFLVIVAGGTVGQVLARTYDWTDSQLLVWNLARFPVGILLALGAFTLLIERSPRRRQPGWSWIAIGAGVALTLWLVFTYALSLYVQTSGSFGSTYGPLTGVIALLLWAYLTSIALFLGIAFCAQLEAVRAGVREPERGDPEARAPRSRRPA